MKFWQKIFICSLLLFLIMFNIGGIFLIQNSYSLSLNKEVKRSLDEYSNILSSIKYYNTITKNLSDLNPEKQDKSNYEKSIKNYFEKFSYRDTYLEVLDENNKKVFSDLDLDIKEEREELKNASNDDIKYIIRSVENKTLLFATSLIDVQGENFKVSYIRDITYIYQYKNEQYKLFIQLSMIISIILAIGMYLLSKYITSPIDKLISSTKIISKGNYSERVSVNSKDEIGILSKHFNEMASTIESKINELEIKSEEKQTFIDNLTHEIKTPLTSILGYTDFLRSISYNEEIYIEGLNNIFKEGKRLEELSWKMMDLILLKKENFKMENQNIKNILEDLNDIFKPKLQSKNINLIIYSEEYEIVVEKDLIKNLISNFIDNSIKASKEGGNIYLNVYKNKENKIVLEVKDEGIGISKEELPKVFEPFYMVDKSRTRANNGAGLGLSICVEIAKIHEAELEIYSEINKGTTIKIIFN